MRRIWIMTLLLCLVLIGCGSEADAGQVAAVAESTTGAEYTTTAESTTETQTQALVESVETSEDVLGAQDSDQALKDIIGQETRVHEFIIPRGKDMFFEALEETYEGLDRLQITYTVPMDYEEVLTYYQELTKRPEPDYHNAYGYFFEDISLGQNDHYIDQILVQGLFGATEIIMIVQNTSHPQVVASQSSEPSPGDPRLTLDSHLQGKALWESASHKGFDAFTGVYLVESPWTENTFKTVWLQESFVAEKQIMDAMNTKFIYYDPNKHLYYELSELVADGGGDKILMGSMVYTPAVQSFPMISYNPLDLGPSTEIQECYLTECLDMPVLYVEKRDPTQVDRSTVKQWISIEHGVAIKEEVYNEASELIQTSTLESMDLEPIPWDVFMPRQDVVYQDRTLSLFFMGNSYSKDFGQAFQATFMEGFFDIDLIEANSGQKLTLTFNGNQMTVMAEHQTPSNMHGQEVEVISYREEEAFKVIVPAQETVYLYPSSIHEHLWFQLDTLGFRKRLESHDAIIYTFEKNDPGSVSGLASMYDYVIDPVSKKFTQVKLYLKDPFTGQEDRSNELTYMVQNPQASSDAVFQVPESYKTVYIFSHDDGEQYPPWWE